MSEILQGELIAFALTTPFLLSGLGWARNLSKKLDILNVNTAAKSARQDATLEDHERRITDLEHPNR